MAISKLLNNIRIWSWYGYFLGILLVTIIHLIQQRISNKKVDKKATEESLGSGEWVSWVVRIAVIVSLFLLFWLGLSYSFFYFLKANGDMLSNVIIIVGVVLNLASFLWFLTVHFNMGMAWSPQPEALEEHKLVTTGLFGFCRHPMYTGLLYHTIPILLLTLNWFVALGWLSVILVYLVSYRIPIEEHILIGLFS